MHGPTERLNHAYPPIGVSWYSDLIQLSILPIILSSIGLLDILCCVRRQQSATSLVSKTNSKSSAADQLTMDNTNSCTQLALAENWAIMVTYSQ